MARPKSPVPSYQFHRPSGQARVRVNGRDVYLGVYDSEASRCEYARIIAELTAAPAVRVAASAPPPSASVNEILAAFWDHAERYYRRPDGTETNELDEYRQALRHVKPLYGHTPAREFGPIALQTVRQGMVEGGWCRTRVNKQIGRVKRAFKWAVAQELVPASVVQALSCVAGLKRGRSDARESAPVAPVPNVLVDATLPYLWPTPRTMVELQRMTGMRPGEVRLLRAADLDTSGEAWIYRPVGHKMSYAGRDRVIPLGPRARAVLVQFLRGGNPPPAGFGWFDPADARARATAAKAYEVAGRLRDASLLRDTSRPVAVLDGCVVDPDAYLFTPANAREERFVIRRKARKSKVPPSQLCRRKPPEALEKKFRDVFTDFGYAAVVRRACERAGVSPWHPNQLRHTFASAVRRSHGLEAAQVVLGHAKADVTQVYAERDLGLAARVISEIG